MKTRLSKLMAERGLCSRREADRLIERGWVLVDGNVVSQLGVKVDPDQEIRLSPKAISQQSERVTIVMNKPVGVVSNQPEDGYREAAALITRSSFAGDPTNWRPLPRRGSLNVAGRLDIDSSGLLVLTQDGRIARALIKPDSRIEKEYRVTVKGNVSEEKIARLRYGLVLDGRQLRRATVTVINDRTLRFVLTQGRKRQIRRMCELVDLHVTGLKRLRIGRVHLGRLPAGKWRYLRAEEAFW